MHGPMKNKKILAITLLLALSTATNVSAQNSTLGEQISGPAINVICGIFNGLKLVGAAIASAVLVYGGVKWLTEADDPAARKNAKDQMKWAIVGLLIILMADGLVGYVLAGSTISADCSFLCNYFSVAC